jgi:predicted unusual protein kinase regulating ubiquinone biosynthesis (AarF/ABC1/UbiB family)
LAAKQLKNGNPEAYVNSQRALARSLTDKLLELGPTFIKLGQLLSTRVDVLSKEFIAELSQLQDQVPGFPGDVAVSIIEAEIGRPIDQIFDTFNRTALAAASLGQVHLATLNGQTLAVKIQRRGLKALFDADLKNIKVLSSLLDKLDPKSDGAQRDWASIYDESAKLLYKEIDYKLEARNCIRFKENFADTPWVKVPNVRINSRWHSLRLTHSARCHLVQRRFRAQCCSVHLLHFLNSICNAVSGAQLTHFFPSMLGPGPVRCC